MEPAAPEPERPNKRQARRRVQGLIATGRLPAAKDVPCTDCGHVWQPGARRHEYDHHLGYDLAHQADVEAVCSRCHHQRERRRDGTSRDAPAVPVAAAPMPPVVEQSDADLLAILRDAQDDRFLLQVLADCTDDVAALLAALADDEPAARLLATLSEPPPAA